MVLCKLSFIHLNHFTAIFDLLRWSGTKLAISLRYALYTVKTSRKGKKKHVNTTQKKAGVATLLLK